MYSFAQRGDTEIVDEPLYGHYLRVSGAEHPGRARILREVETDGERVIREVILGPSAQPVLFMKQMAHHLVDLSLQFLRQTENILLIRDPFEVLLSLRHQIQVPVLRDTGLADQVRLLKDLRHLGQEPVVLDSRELLLDPQGVLTQLCARLGIPFEDGMLSWAAGARPEDGVWAEYWYHRVHQSTGFRPYQPKHEPLPEGLKALLSECKPFYDELYRSAIRAGTSAGLETKS